MSIVIDAEGERATGSGLAGISSAGFPLVGGFFKYSSGSAHATDYIAVLSQQQDLTATHVRGQLNATPQFLFGGKSSTGSVNTAGAVAWTDDAWHLWAVGWGPHDGSSQARFAYLDGTVTLSSTNATVSHTVDLDEICISGAWGSGIPQGRHGEVFATSVADGAEAEALLDAIWADGSAFLACDHPTVVAIHEVLYYWPLFDDLASDLGSSTLTNVGTFTFDTGDHPAVSHSDPGGGGSVITAGCLMHRETPRQQARRLGFSGWRAAVEL